MERKRFLVLELLLGLLVDLGRGVEMGVGGSVGRGGGGVGLWSGC